MSTQGKRDFRPAVHFSPIKGWINDPNGLVYYGGRYHLFAQHNPHDTVWGPMHWYHAVSDDRITWEHLPIAIYPDEDGTIYSGSAVADTDNLSGFGSEGETPLIAMYTRRGETEDQCIAYSLDGITFTKYAQNPVIKNPGIRDFRDTKIFRNTVKGGWSMVLAAKDRVHFYSTNDFRSWTKTGEFGPEGNHAQGVWECPDLIPFTFCGETLWLLIVSNSIPIEEGGASAQYFIGDFDGDTFGCTVPFGHVERIDSGWDNYAGVSYNNTDEPVLIGWGVNWAYASKTPTGEYCGHMTLPRKLSIVKTPEGSRLASKVVGLDSYIGEGRPANGTIDTETFLLKLEGTGPCAATFTNKEGQRLVFGVDGENNLFVNRAEAGASDFCEVFASELFSVAKAPRLFGGAFTLELYFDVSILELFADGGTRCITMVVYPDSPYTELRTEGELKATFYPVKPKS